MEPLQLELNCNKIFGMHDCAWLHLFTDEQLPKKTGSRLATAHGETVTATAKVDVKITGLPVGSEEVTVSMTGH